MHVRIARQRPGIVASWRVQNKHRTVRLFTTSSPPVSTLAYHECMPRQPVNRSRVITLKALWPTHSSTLSCTSTHRWRGTSTHHFAATAKIDEPTLHTRGTSGCVSVAIRCPVAFSPEVCHPLDSMSTRQSQHRKRATSSGRSCWASEVLRALAIYKAL